MKRFLASAMLCIFSVISLSGTYYYWRQTKTMLEAAEKSETDTVVYKTEKVTVVDFYDEIHVDGTLKSVHTEKYSFDPVRYKVNQYLPVRIGEIIEKGVQLCIPKDNSDSVIWTRASGTVTEDKIGEDGFRTITIEDTAHLKACFYIPQNYISCYTLQEQIEIQYNENFYPATITFIDQRMTDCIIINDQGKEITEKKLYMEAELDADTSMHINGAVQFYDKIQRQKNIMAIPKNAVQFEEDTAYVNVLDADNQLHRVNVILGDEKENLVTVQSKELYIGDRVIIN